MIRAWLENDRELIYQLQGTPAAMQHAIEKAVKRLANMLLRHVKEDKLSGQVLNVSKHGGRLRRSINDRVEPTATGAYGIVGTNVEYAHVHEYGFKGTVSVREYVRRIKKQATVRGRLRQIKSETTVRAHTRHMNMPERSFLRSALADKRAQIEDEIRKAVERAAREGKA
jgi:phage gpG-like protein